MNKMHTKKAGVEVLPSQTEQGTNLCSLGIKFSIETLLVMAKGIIISGPPCIMFRAFYQNLKPTYLQSKDKSRHRSGRCTSGHTSGPGRRPPRTRACRRSGPPRTSRSSRSPSRRSLREKSHVRLLLLSKVAWMGQSGLGWRVERN